MQKILCGMLLCAVLLTGCKSTSRNTSTPAGPAHNVPPAVYPGPNTENPVGANPAYPGPQGNNTANVGVPYPGPATPAGSTPTNPYAPALGDETLDRGNAFVEMDNSALVQMETDPLQVKIHLKGSLPNPCHQLRVNPAQPDGQKHVQVDVYSVTKPGEMCTEVLQAFGVQIPLGSFSAGHYSIYINGELLAEFDA